MSRKKAAGRKRAGSPARPRHPMPCPRCRRIIDAGERLCPFCGVDTDKALAPARRALPFVAIALLVAVLALARALPKGWNAGLAAGLAAAFLIMLLRGRGR